MIGFALLLIVSGCSSFGQMNSTDNDKQTPDEHMDDSENENDSSNDQKDMEEHEHDMPLESSTGENELNIPSILENDKETKEDVYYTIDAQQGQTEIFDDIQTKTLGYNSSFLDRKSTRLNSSHVAISYAVFCL